MIDVIIIASKQVQGIPADSKKERRLYEIVTRSESQMRLLWQKQVEHFVNRMEKFDRSAYEAIIHAASESGAAKAEQILGNTERTSHSRSGKPRRQFGSAKGLLTTPDDFNEPLEDFEEYM